MSISLTTAALPQEPDHALHVERLCKNYGKQQIVSEISLMMGGLVYAAGVWRFGAVRCGDN